MTNQNCEKLAYLMMDAAEKYLNASMNEEDFRIAVNRLALLEREIPQPENPNRYLASKACYQALNTEVLVSTDDCFSFRFDSTLPNRGLFTNQFLKNFIFDFILENCEIDVNQVGKIHIRMEQYIKPTTTGKLRKDADNNEKKGVIDGITDALGIDDTGDRVAYSSTIKPLSDNREKPYTIITIIQENELDGFFENLLLKQKRKEKEKIDAIVQESIEQSLFPECYLEYPDEIDFEDL